MAKVRFADLAERAGVDLKYLTDISNMQADAPHIAMKRSSLNALLINMRLYAQMFTALTEKHKEATEKEAPDHPQATDTVPEPEPG